MSRPSFTIRVYGILIHEDQVLLSKENYSSTSMLKFPGGGLEFGEGTTECLKREMMEEFGLEVEVIDHLYTTDFFVESAFHPQTQVISIYYRMEMDTSNIPINKVFTEAGGDQCLVWGNLKQLKASDLTFPIDQHVLGMLMNR